MQQHSYGIVGHSTDMKLTSTNVYAVHIGRKTKLNFFTSVGKTTVPKVPGKLFHVHLHKYWFYA